MKIPLYDIKKYKGTKEQRFYKILKLPELYQVVKNGEIDLIFNHNNSSPEATLKILNFIGVGKFSSPTDSNFYLNAFNAVDYDLLVALFSRSHYFSIPALEWISFYHRRRQ